VAHIYYRFGSAGAPPPGRPRLSAPA
jgi:hypothetical protein